MKSRPDILRCTSQFHVLSFVCLTTMYVYNATLSSASCLSITSYCTVMENQCCLRKPQKYPSYE